MNIVELCNIMKFDYNHHVDEFVRIGDITAIRLLKKTHTQYRKNYERGILMVALANRINAKRVLEFGTGRGYVCACITKMCKSVEEVVTIDKNDPDEVRNYFIELELPLKKMTFVTGNANSLDQKAVSGQFDLVFIDAQHDGKSVKANYAYSLSKSHNDTITVFDDYRSRFPSVKKGINKIKANKRIVNTDGWIIDNICIQQAGDADRVVEGREFDSGLVVSSTSDVLSRIGL